jgi:hypothetical protein
MRSPTLLAALTVPFIGLCTGAPRRARAQVDTVRWRVTAAIRCSQADSLFGRYWRSHASSIRVGYSRRRDVTTLKTPDRHVSWQQSGSSRLVGTEAVIRVPGQQARLDSARIELTMRFIDSTYRSPAQANLTFVIDDSVRIEIPEPEVEYVTGPQVRGIGLLLTVPLTPEQSRALARLPRQVTGTMGPIPFFLYDWELWDLNSVYRGSVCGVEP